MYLNRKKKCNINSLNLIQNISLAKINYLLLLASKLFISFFKLMNKRSFSEVTISKNPHIQNQKRKNAKLQNKQ